LEVEVAKKKTDYEKRVEQRKQEIVKEFEQDRIDRTRKAKSFEQIDKHFNEAVEMLGGYLDGCKALFWIESVKANDDKEMVFFKVEGKSTSGHRPCHANHILESKRPSDFVAYLLWDCIGYANGVFKFPF
jgi:hypothetical protein